MPKGVTETSDRGVDERLLASVPEQASEAILVADTTGVIRYVNPAFESVYGHKSSEVVGNNLRSFYGCEEDEAPFREMWKGVLLGNAWHGEIAVKSSDGSRCRDEVVIYPLRNADGVIHHVVAVSREKDKRPGQLAELRQAKKMEAIGQLASGIAHEINTPTQYIGDNIQFLKESFEGIHALLRKYQELLGAVEKEHALQRLAEDIKIVMHDIDIDFVLTETPGAIERAIEGNKRVAEVVRAMKEFAHPGAEERTPSDINRAILNTIAVSRNEWKYVADVETDLAPDLPMVPCILGAFNQVVLNIVVNAAHAIEGVVGDGAQGKGTITVSTRRAQDWVEIRISDTGTGIPENVQSRIFNPFFTTKQVGRGTGQGLAIARSVVEEAHHGSLDFETEVGKGTTFVIRLPLQELADE